MILDRPIEYPGAAFLFADIAGFTEHSRRERPRDTVERLHHVFSTFDAIAYRHGVTRIRLCGDGYFAAHLTARKGLYAVADTALEFIEQDLWWADGVKMELRIGLNMGGPVVAASIGLIKRSFDVWGDAVNLAARMEATGEPGRIQVTTAAYFGLKDRYRLVERGAIAVKGRGDMVTYWLEGRCPELPD